MSLKTSQTIVRVMGILDIISAVLALFAALAMFGIGGLGLASPELADAAAQEGLTAVFAAGLIMLVGAAVNLIEGIFCLRAAKDAKQAQPLWIISLAAVIFSVLGLLLSFGSGTEKITGEAVKLLFNCATFYLANNIKKNA